MSLTFQSFKKIMAEQMFATFGQESYPALRLEMIWKAVSDLPEKNFLIIVRHFVANHSIKYPPNVSDFIEKAHEQRKTLHASETRQAANTLQTIAARDNESLKRALDELGEKSLMDAVFKKHKGAC